MVESEPRSVPARVTGRGWHVPSDRLTNADLCACVDGNRLKDWAQTNAWARVRLQASTGQEPDLEELYAEYVGDRIGIRERRVVDREAVLMRRASARDAFASDLGAEASRKALEDAGVAVDEVEVIICGTSSPDAIYPPTAVEIQQQLGAERAHAYDLLAACASFAFGLHIARSLVGSGAHSRVLVVAAEYFSATVDYADPASAFFWGDCAVAAVVEAGSLARKKPGFEIVATHCRTVPSRAIRCGFGGTRAFQAQRRAPASLRAEPGAADYPYFFQDAARVYRDVVPMVVSEVEALLSAEGLRPGDVDQYWFHQASRLLLGAITRRLLGETLPHPRVPTPLEQFGNTSSCGGPLCLALDERCRPGDIAALVVFGAGYSLGSALLRRV